MRHAIAVVLCAAAVSANAGVFDSWTDDSISDITGNVTDVRDKVLNGNIPQSAADLRRQLTKLQERGHMLSTTVEELLVWLERRRTPYLAFVGSGGSGPCGAGTTCATFRSDLRNFSLDMADLKQRYEVIDRLGLGDGTFLANLADEMPPFVLFGLHEIFQRMPGWQDIPLDLADVFDEIGDPDAFAVDSGIAFGVTAGTRARAAAVSAQAATEPETATDKFCTKLAKRTVDQVKVNRMKAFVFLLKSVFDAASEYPPEDANLSLIGEGAGSLKIPLKPFLVTVKVTIEVIQNFVETWRANVGVCRAIEVDLAGCTKLAEYRTSPAGNDKAYFLVKAVITGLDDQGVDVAVAKELLKKAENARDNSNWHKSFDRLCEAYAEL